MNTPVKEFLSQIKVGAKQSHKNMTLYCLLSAHEAPVDFLTLDEALEREALVITEVNEGGSVAELKVANKSDQKVLLAGRGRTGWCKAKPSLERYHSHSASVRDGHSGVLC